MANHIIAGESAVPVIWRTRDVADLYGVDESTVRRWERSGRLRAARFDPGGNRYWLRHEIIADSLADSTVGAAAPAAIVDSIVAATKRIHRSREMAR